MDWTQIGEILAAIFAGLCTLLGIIYGVVSVLIGKYFDEKQKNEDNHFGSIDEKTKSLESTLDVIQKRLEVIRENANSMIDLKVRELIKEIREIAEAVSRITANAAVLEERSQNSSEKFYEAAKDFKTFIAAVTRRLTEIQSEQIRLSQDLVLIKERKKGGS